MQGLMFQGLVWIGSMWPCGRGKRGGDEMLETLVCLGRRESPCMSQNLACHSAARQHK